MQHLNKIILVGIWYSGSAATNRLIAYAKGYAAAGKEVLIICRSLENFQWDLGDGIKTIIYPENSTYSKLWGRISVYRKVVRTIKETYVDSETAVHIYGLPVWGFMLPKEKYNVFYERTEAPYYQNGGLIYKICETIQLSMVKYAKGLFVISESLRSEFHRRGVKNIEIINMFVDSERFEGIPVMNKTKYIAYCGVLTVHKDGVDDLIRAFHIFHKQFPEYKLMLIGDSHLKQVVHQLYSIVDSLNLNNDVIFTGHISPDDIPALLKNASILALARPNNKQAQYGFPTKLGEYLSTGNPVVVTRVGEIDKFLQDKVNCIFSIPDNPEDFAEKLLWVEEHPIESKKIGERAGLLIKNDFSSKIQSLRALAFMQRIINQ